MEKPEMRRDLPSGELRHDTKRVAGLKLVYETSIIWVSLMCSMMIALVSRTATMSVKDEVHARSD